MSIRTQRLFAWCGVAFAVTFFGGMVLAGLLPPHPPSDSAAAATTRWVTDPQLRRLGLWLCMMAAGLGAPFAAVISVYLKKIEPAGSCSNLQLIGGALGVVAILIPVFLWCAAGYRAGTRPDEITQALNDAAWIPFVMNTPPALMQCFAIGFATLGDRGARPVMPRWVGYYNIWTALLFLPGGFVVFFKGGPLAWDGVIAFWMVAVLFGAWFIVMTFVILKAISRSAEDQHPGPATA